MEPTTAADTLSTALIPLLKNVQQYAAMRKRELADVTALSNAVQGLAHECARFPTMREAYRELTGEVAKLEQARDALNADITKATTTFTSVKADWSTQLAEAKRTHERRLAEYAQAESDAKAAVDVFEDRLAQLRALVMPK